MRGPRGPLSGRAASMLRCWLGSLVLSPPVSTRGLCSATARIGVSVHRADPCSARSCHRAPGSRPSSMGRPCETVSAKTPTSALPAGVPAGQLWASSRFAAFWCAGESPATPPLRRAPLPCPRLRADRGPWRGVPRGPKPSTRVSRYDMSGVGMIVVPFVRQSNAGSPALARERCLSWCMGERQVYRFMWWKRVDR